ncbi:AraC family transcriptional regulator [Caulobacter flavus]|uniref:AraC family transcriptional regulator n=1 Tax=Caulobacter flavus TaxID=1679497 RepID=A0A2N5CS21_9CAUL|nr:helix-turn-helix transcriptional regulator [Caulobacter flavus]AYV46499.1 AraC family transcriptional regulator [Caulobacter flavus]PLR12796.1 AraC family transcriptional regulator [Caulobacter flavus]
MIAEQSSRELSANRPQAFPFALVDDDRRPRRRPGQAPDLATIDLLVRESLERLEDDPRAVRRCLTAARRLLTPEDHNPPGGLAPWQVKRIGRYVDEGLDRRLTLAEAAEQVRLSPSHFSRCFRVSFGAPFSKHVTRRRLERARWLMMTTGQSLGQIALACGFADQAHFTRAFTNLTGGAPGRWRRLTIDAERLAQ